MSELLTDAEINQRHAWMAVALRDYPNLENILDRVCAQAAEANTLRAALAEVCDLYDRTAAGALFDIERIAAIRSEHLVTTLPAHGGG